MFAYLVIPSMAALATTAVAVIAVVIAAKANRTANAANELQVRLANDTIERDEFRRRREVAAAVRLWYEFALLNALAGKAWASHPLGVERGDRADRLVSEYGDRDFESYKNSIAAHVITTLNNVGLKRREPSADDIRSLGSVEAHIRLWVADPEAFITDEAVSERIASIRKTNELLGYT